MKSTHLRLLYSSRYCLIKGDLMFELYIVNLIEFRICPISADI